MDPLYTECDSVGYVNPLKKKINLNSSPRSISCHTVNTSRLGY